MENETLVGKYIGSFKIKEATPSESKTPQGDSIVDFVFESGEKVSYPVKVLAAIVTDKASDETSVQEAKVAPLVGLCMDLAIEYNLKYSDIEAFMRQLMTNLHFHFDRAENFLWNQDDRMFVPGFDVKYEVTMLDALKVLRDIPADTKSKKDGKDN